MSEKVEVLILKAELTDGLAQRSFFHCFEVFDIKAPRSENDPVVEQSHAIVTAQKWVVGSILRRNDIRFGNAVLCQRFTDILGQHGEHVARRP